jgi:uncharacterized membrane protein
MSWEQVVAHVLLPGAVAAAAGFGAWRCWRLLRYGKDPRLVKLMWFYGLFAASLVAVAIWSGQLHWAADGNLSGMHSGDSAEAHGDMHGAFGGAERINIFLLAHHALMLVSLGVAVQAFGHRRIEGAAVAVVGLAFFGPFIPVVLAIEAAMTLYLAVQAILNHMDRRTPGALQVAAGFFLFFIGHLGFFLFHQPGGTRTPLGDVFALVGIVLLVQLLPRPST